jgi:hypothetical protein
MSRSMHSRFRAALEQKPDSESHCYSPDIKLSQFLIKEYGNVDFVIDVADNLINFARRFKKDSKRYQATLSFLKYGIPAAVVTAQLAGKLKKFMHIKEGKNSTYNAIALNICSLMGIKESSSDLAQDGFYLGKDVYNWLFQNPNTTEFKILGFYTYDGMTPVVDLWGIDAKRLLAAIECSGIVFVWDLVLANSSESDVLYVKESAIFYQSKDEDKKLCFKAAIYKEFLKHLDIEHNAICLSPNGLSAIPRQEIGEQISQFNLIRFVAEIRKVLKRKKKRGFAFVGVPGTGKSTIIRKLSSQVIEYPIIYTTAANYASTYSIIDTFKTIEYLQPCIVVMEDLDSYDLRDKKNTLGVFLDLIDDVNNRLNVVFIATINDTSLVHYSLINRPGRFDQVILVKPPQTVAEVYDVMTARYSKNQKKDEALVDDFPSLDFLDQDLLKSIIAEGYTHADICEIIEKAILLSDNICNDTLTDSLNELKESKEAIKKCDFKGEDPRNNEYEDTVCIESSLASVPRDI